MNITKIINFLPRSIFFYHLAILGIGIPLVIYLNQRSQGAFFFWPSIRRLGAKPIVNTDIAIGMGITSARARSVEDMPFFKFLLPSFCMTASVGYVYFFYLTYDFNDKFFSNDTLLKFWKERFTNVTLTLCHHLGNIEVDIHECKYSGRPSWAQNDAMMRAYKDGRDFFYRINDDIIMTSSNWTNVFINELRKMVPPLVGVVGPNHHGGRTNILTHDFVHRTHIDIFGFYYPRAFRTWHADEWITKVYIPGRSKKVKMVTLTHKIVKSRYRGSNVSRKYFSRIFRKTLPSIER